MLNTNCTAFVQTGHRSRITLHSTLIIGWWAHLHLRKFNIYINKKKKPTTRITRLHFGKTKQTTVGSSFFSLSFLSLYENLETSVEVCDKILRSANSISKTQRSQQKRQFLNFDNLLRVSINFSFYVYLGIMHHFLIEIFRIVRKGFKNVNV